MRGRAVPCPRTASEIEEYCRDPDSTGCSLEMMDALLAEAKKNEVELEAAVAAQKYRRAADLQDQRLRILCIGLGAGNVPSFFVHHLRHCDVEVVELGANA